MPSHPDPSCYHITADDFPHFSHVVHLPEEKTALDELTGFDRTGDARIWPGGEALAWWILGHGNLVEGKRVLELGAGKVGLPSLACVECAVSSVEVTDGNQKCVELLRFNVEKSKRACDVDITRLLWGRAYCREEKRGTVEVILAGDAVFFEAQHGNLLDTVDHYLAREGEAWFSSPERKGSLERFMERVEEDGWFAWSEVSDFQSLLFDRVSVPSDFDWDSDWPKLVVLRRT